MSEGSAETGEVCGEWEALVRPISDDLELPGEMGLTVTLKPATAKRMGKAMVLLARTIDAQDAARYADKVFRRALTRVVLLALALVAAGWLLNG